MKPEDLALGRWQNRLLIGGAVSFLLGFAWFAVFVGLPYPDPTPEQYQDERLHTSVSDAMMLGGILAIAAGLAARLIAWMLARGRRSSGSSPRRGAMDALELKVPPPLVALLVAVVMWGIGSLTPAVSLPIGLRAACASVVALLGGAFSLAGLVAFRRAKTTVNPMKPDAASSLVSSGVYRITRNPMYVGLLLVLLAWAILLAAPWTLVGPVCFMLYIGRFQIRPEERVLTRMFGDDFVAYRARVRRWL